MSVASTCVFRPLQMQTLDLRGIPAACSPGGAVPVGISDPIQGTFSVTFGSGVSCRCTLPFPDTLHPISEWAILAMEPSLVPRPSSK